MKVRDSLLSATAILVMTCQASAADLTAKVEQALRKSCAYLVSISTGGGYAGIYSRDLKKRYGEAFYEEASETQIWVQPPGTPSVGECFLRAYELNGEEFYLDAAKSAAKALAWGQSSHGGWGHLADVSGLVAGETIWSRKDYPCTIDDNITQGTLAFLIKLDKLIKEKWLAESVRLGLEFMQQSQFPNGAWPQWYPLRGGYHDYYTFNDNAINDCIRVLLIAQREYGSQEFLICAEKAGDFIINSQLPPPQAGWAQQYSHDLRPAWARDFEPPGLCSLVTARNIHTLVDLYYYTGNKAYLEPIPAAINWLEKSKLGPSLWARLYEVGTNRPIYGDNDRKVHYVYEEISLERRTGYNFKGSFGIKEAVSYYEKAKNASSASMGLSRERSADILPLVEKALSEQDEQGRWLRGNGIYIQDFVRNINLLCDYLELSKTGD